MTNHVISSLDVRYSSLSGLADNDEFTLSGISSFIIDQSTVIIDEVDFSDTFQSLVLENTSTTQPNIVRLNGTFNGVGATLNISGLLINVAVANGAASQVFTIPSDSLGNFPSVLGYVYVDDVVYTQVTSFSDIRADFRGYHFVYNSVSGQITFGDGINGFMPSGQIKIENIFVDGGVVNLGSQGKMLGVGHAVFCECDFSSGLICNVDSSWGIINNSNEFVPYSLAKHDYGSMNYIGVGSSNRVRFNLGEDTVGNKVLFQTENNSSTEIGQNVNVPMWGDYEFRILAQRSSNSSRVRMYNNGGDATLKIYQGYGAIFTPYGGIGGKWDVEWSDGYLLTDTSPFEIIFGRYPCDLEIMVRHRGIVDWSGEREYVIRCVTGKWKFGTIDEQMVFPAGMIVDEIFNLSGDSSGWCDNISFNGVSNSGTRDFNISAPNGWLMTNIEVPNDSSHGMQAETNCEYQFFSCVGQTPAFSSGMSSSVIVKNAARDLGEVWFMPHYNSPNGSIVTGNETDFIYQGSRLYITNIGDKIETKSNVISGCGAVTGLGFQGSSVGNFSFEYKMWQASEAEPASYKAMTQANVISDSSSYTTTTKWYFKYTVEKISGAANQGYLQGIYLSVPLDSAYKWVEPAAQSTLSVPNVWDGSGALLLNGTQLDGLGLPTFIDFQTVSGGNGYSFTLTEGVHANIGDEIILRLGFQNLFTAAEKKSILFTYTGSDLISPEVQEFNIYYPDLQIDGSTQDASNGGELSVVNGQVKININDGDGIYDPRGIAAWTYYMMTTRIGLQYFLAYLQFWSWRAK